MFERGLSYLKKASTSPALVNARPVENRRSLRGIRHRSSRNGAVEACKTVAAAATWCYEIHVVFTKLVNERSFGRGGRGRRTEFDNALPWERTEIRVSPLLRYANLLNGINARLES